MTLGGGAGCLRRRFGWQLHAQTFGRASATSVSDRATSTKPGGSGATLPAKPTTTVHRGVPFQAGSTWAKPNSAEAGGRTGTPCLSNSRTTPAPTAIVPR